MYPTPWQSQYAICTLPELSIGSELPRGKSRSLHLWHNSYHLRGEVHQREYEDSQRRDFAASGMFDLQTEHGRECLVGVSVIASSASISSGTCPRNFFPRLPEFQPRTLRHLSAVRRTRALRVFRKDLG